MHPQGVCPAFSCCLSAGSTLKGVSFPARGCWWVSGVSIPSIPSRVEPHILSVPIPTIHWDQE